MNKPLARRTGVLLIILSLLCNPYCIQFALLANHRIGNVTHIAMIFSLEFLFFCLGGLLLLLSRHDATDALIHALLSICSLLLTLGCLEGISRVVLAMKSDAFALEQSSINKHVYDDVSPDAFLGFVLKNNYTYRAWKRNTRGETIYDVMYTTDAFGRRIMASESGSISHGEANHFLLFGDSYTFGEGLADQDTLHYFLEKNTAGYRIYNYAVHGYGPQAMLAKLEQGRLPAEVPEKNGIAVYVYLENHIYRLIGSTKTPWVNEQPYYSLDATGNVVHTGNFWNGKPIRTFLYDAYERLYHRSALLHLTKLHFPIVLHTRDIDLMTAVIDASKRRYQEQFRGRFYVLIHPLTERTPDIQGLVSELRSRGIAVIEPPIADKPSYRIPRDFHPTGTVNRLIARYVLEYLSLPHSEF